MKDAHKLKQVFDASERKPHLNFNQPGENPLVYNIRARGNSDDYNLNMATPTVVRNPSSFRAMDHNGGVGGPHAMPTSINI